MPWPLLHASGKQGKNFGKQSDVFGTQHENSDCHRTQSDFAEL